MNISQVAQLTGLSTKQIRDYEKIGLINIHRSGQSGYRTYCQQDIDRLHFIARSREVGFSLSQIQSLLDLKDNPNRKSCDVKTLTAHHISQLDDKIAQLQQMKHTLQQWHDLCAGDMGSDCAILNSLNS